MKTKFRPKILPNAFTGHAAPPFAPSKTTAKKPLADAFVAGKTSSKRATRLIGAGGVSCTRSTGAGVGRAVELKFGGARTQRIKEDQRCARTIGPMHDYWRWGARDPSSLARKTGFNALAADQTNKIRGILDSCSSAREVRRFARAFGKKVLGHEDRMLFLEAFRDNRAFGDLVSFYEKSVATDPDFAALAIPRELYVVALNKSGQRQKAVQVARQMCSSLAGPDGKVRSMCIDLDDIHPRDGVNGEVLGGLGSVFKSIANDAENAKLHPRLKALVADEAGVSDPPADFDYAQAALQASTRYYEAGFAVDFEYYPGINAIYNAIRLGEDATAERLAPLVKLACEKAGGSDANDYWCTTTMLELAVITDSRQDVRALLPKVLARAKVDWEIGATAQSLETLDRCWSDTGRDTRLVRALADELRQLEQGDLPPSSKDIEDIVARVQAHLPKSSVAGASQASDVKTSDLFNAIETRSTYFKGLSSHYLGGNVPYGGNVPDISVGREDIRLCRALLDEIGVDHTSDFEAFNAKVDAFLAAKFELGDPRGRRPLEDLHSDEHEVMDRFRASLLDVTQAKRTGQTKTSVIAEIAMGCGDCRQVAYAKQLLYDVWKKDAQTTAMRDAYAALRWRNDTDYEAAMAKVHALDAEQLVTLTVQVNAPIEMDSMYHMRTDASGAPIRLDGVSNDDTDQFSPVENHTFNARVVRSADGDVALEWRDAFYQQLYDWSNMSVKPENILSDDGFFGGYMNPPGDYDGEPIRVQMTVTPYSAGEIKPVKGEFGGVRVGGQHTSSPPMQAILQPSQMRPVVESIAQLGVV